MEQLWQLSEVLRQIRAEQLQLETALWALQVAGEVWEDDVEDEDFTDLADGVEDSGLAQAHRVLYEAGSIQVDMNGVIQQAKIDAASGAGKATMHRLLDEMRALFQEEVKVSEDLAAQRQLLRQQAIEVAEAARVAAQVASSAEELALLI